VPAAARAGLCAPDETVLFQCSLAEGKRVAVCASSAASSASYRFGKPGAVELEYPGTAGAGRLSWAQTAYSGGGEAQIRFAKDGYDYVVYSRVVRTGFAPGGTNDPKDEAGVLVLKGERVVANNRCVAAEDPAEAPWIDTEQAAKRLPETEIVYHD
jgi:hypothetical protein